MYPYAELQHGAPADPHAAPSRVEASEPASGAGLHLQVTGSTPYMQAIVGTQLLETLVLDAVVLLWRLDVTLLNEMLVDEVPLAEPLCECEVVVTCVEEPDWLEPLVLLEPPPVLNSPPPHDTGAVAVTAAASRHAHVVTR